MNHPAAVGGATRCAIIRRPLPARQMHAFAERGVRPSNKASNCARDNRIVPSCNPSAARARPFNPSTGRIDPFGTGLHRGGAALFQDFANQHKTIRWGNSPPDCFLTLLILPDCNLQPVAPPGTEHDRNPGMRIQLQLGLHKKRQSVRRENDPPDRSLTRLPAHTGRLPAAWRSGPAAAAPRRSRGPSHCARQRRSPFCRNIPRHPQHKVAADLDGDDTTDPTSIR